MDIAFVPARPEDFDYFYDLRRRTMLEHFARVGKIWDDGEPERHRQAFDTQSLRMIHEGARRVGFVDVREAGGAMRVSLFCVEPDRQNRGIGGRVMRSILGEADRAGKKVMLDILKGNRAARLYERLGFQRTPQMHDVLLYYERQALAL